MWNPDLPTADDFRTSGSRCPTTRALDNGFRVQWEQFLRHVVEGAPFGRDFWRAPRGVQLAELGLQSAREGRRVEVPELAPVTSRSGCPDRRRPCGRGCATRRRWPRPRRRRTPGVAYAAAHVVADPLADNTAGAPPALDWDATLAFRHHLWSHGLGVADAMDTAQRGMGLDWAGHRAS